MQNPIRPIANTDYSINVLTNEVISNTTLKVIPQLLNTRGQVVVLLNINGSIKEVIVDNLIKQILLSDIKMLAALARLEGEIEEEKNS